MKSKTEDFIGPYRILKPIARGGMGEVLLAYDPICDRQVALKRIRPDLKKHEVLKNRFLHEAKLTGGLTHPGIISIYSIHKDEDLLYYTMPYVEGETLRQFLRNEISPSIPALIPIFQSICQTVAYIHSRQIIHRDLKPENVLVGKFGEVIILDWGLAQHLSEADAKENSMEVPEQGEDLTHPGKIVGTLAYMSPERAFGSPASIQSDVYALGVILYQMLTLHLPFSRGTLKEFKKNHRFEKIPDPEEAAPYRDVPPRLSRIVKRCLEPNPKNRYSSVEELTHDIKSFMEGRSEWFESARLSIHRKKDWEFQENLLISKHIAITRGTEEAEWVSIMLSKSPFAENARLETKVYVGETGRGIGFLLSVPEASERDHPLEGYCLWLGTEDQAFSQLFRNTVEVMRSPDLFLKRGNWHSVTIEKIDNNIHFTLDGVRRITYVSYLPLVGTHVGILSRDADFQMEEIVVYVGSQNLQVSCLSIPDAFLANKDYKRALGEYRRIGQSFPGHAEGREALFRSGITLLEQAKNCKNEKRAQSYCSLALEEFAKLHRTPGAPLEYLGKSLVYFAMKDYTEEIKCLEFALRRYHKHPLIRTIKEQILYRMHESAQKDRRSAYQLILLSLRHLPEVMHEDCQRLFRYLITHWEPLPFLESPPEPSTLGKEETEPEARLNKLKFSISLSFWLAAPNSFLEIFQDLLTLPSIEPAPLGDLLYCLIEIGSSSLAAEWIRQLETEPPSLELELTQELKKIVIWLKPLTGCNEKTLGETIQSLFLIPIEDLGIKELRSFLYLIQYALKSDQETWAHAIFNYLEKFTVSREDRIAIDAYRIWTLLKEKKWTEAGKIFDNYSYELLNQESTLLHPLYGCWLYVTEGEEIAKIHFAGVIDTPFPRTWALLSHELINKITENSAWFNISFLWERRHLYWQLSLYYHCTENPELEAYYRHLEKQEYVIASTFYAIE